MVICMAGNFNRGCCYSSRSSNSSRNMNRCSYGCYSISNRGSYGCRGRSVVAVS